MKCAICDKKIEGGISVVTHPQLEVSAVLVLHRTEDDFSDLQAINELRALGWIDGTICADCWEAC